MAAARAFEEDIARKKRGLRARAAESGIPRDVRFEVKPRPNAFEVRPIENHSQAALAVLANMITNCGWAISNVTRKFSPAALPLIVRARTLTALWPGGHWFIGWYGNPIVVHRDQQYYRAGLNEFISTFPSRGRVEMTDREFWSRSRTSITATMSPEEAQRFLMNTR